MTIYDEFMQDAIDVHCHIDFEFSAKERKREPEFQWLPKAETMGMRGVVLKSHWWPTVNVVPYILSSVQTKVPLVERRSQYHRRRPKPLRRRSLRGAGWQDGLSSDLERAQRRGAQRLQRPDQIVLQKPRSIRKSELLLSRQ